MIKLIQKSTVKTKHDEVKVFTLKAFKTVNKSTREEIIQYRVNENKVLLGAFENLVEALALYNIEVEKASS